MIDHRPALIARCGSVDDVVNAVSAAREAGLEIGVRRGGHKAVEQVVGVVERAGLADRVAELRPIGVVKG